MTEENITSKAQTLHKEALFADILLPLTRMWDTRLPQMHRFRAAGCDYTSLTMIGDYFTDPSVMLRFIAAQRAAILSCPDDFALANTVADIRRAKAEGKMAVNLHFQGSEAISRDLNFVEAFYTLGVKFMLIAYNMRNSAGTGCLEPKDDGLSLFGQSLVKKMNEVGMIVDGSHCGPVTAREAFELSEKPPIYSHSNARVLRDHPRNAPDELLKLVANKGGWIGINGVGAFLDDNQVATPETMLRHITYMVDLVGPDHVGLGSDWIFEEHREELYEMDRKSPLFGMGFEPPWNFVGPEEFPRITELLLREGYSDTHIRGILGENFLRVAEANWGA